MPGIAGFILILLNLLISYKGFSNPAFFQRHIFHVDAILRNRQYGRLVTAGFLHNGWMHLIFNLVGLLAFGDAMEHTLGTLPFLAIYFAGLAGGNLFALWIHRNHGGYSAAGASGAVCGLIFGSIALFPGMSIGIFLIPVSIPGWIYGLIFLVYSIYGIRSQYGNSGHEAHLGGALAGMLVAIAFEPAAFSEHYPIILLLALPTIAFMVLTVTHPHLLMVQACRPRKNHYSIDHSYNEEKLNRQQEIDRILDKINHQGMKGLTPAEKQLLKEYSQSIR